MFSDRPGACRARGVAQPAVPWTPRPVPPATCAVLSLMLAQAAWAGGPLDPLLACRSVSDAASRLACYDREAAALAHAAPEPPATPSGSAAERSPAALDPKRTFGLPSSTITQREIAAGTRQADVASVSAHILRVAAASNGRMIFTLDNDQVWEQLLAEGDLLAKPGQTVRISRGFLGSYWLEVQSGRGCKVRRLQ